MQHRLGWLLVITLPLTSLGFLTLANTARAQIAPDNTLGAESSVVTPDTINGIPSERIDGGATRGANLFHSFEDFNVGEGRGAYFSNPAAIENILSRVTGSNPSNILGTLGVLGDANLFLLNPNGIVFGPNARLDVRGSFLGSTADSLVFDNGFEFSASNPQAPPLLTVNIPIGLRFRENPGNIINQSVEQDLLNGNPVGLQVPTGKSIGLVGGNVNLSSGGRLTAAEGRVELGGLAGVGTVGLTLDDNNLSLSFPTDSQLAKVTLAEDARVSVLGLGGGNIFVNANIFAATDGGRLVAGTGGARNGEDITVNANTVNLSGEGVNAGSGLYNQALPGSTGNAGNIIVNTQLFTADSGSGLTIVIGGTGNGGDIILNADQINLSGVGNISGLGSGLYNQALSDSTGNAGNIFINSRSFRTTSGATVNADTSSAGNGGNIQIVSTDLVELIDGKIETRATECATGDAGNILITPLSSNGTKMYAKAATATQQAFQPLVQRF